MTDTASSRYGARQQSQGSNTNTWGDDKLNEVIRLFDRGSKGVQSLAMTGDTTLSWTNYIATNDGQVSVLLLTGSLSSAANLIVPSREWQWDVIKNSTGQTITVKTSAGTGVAIANGQYMSIYCDAADCYNGSPTNLPGAVTVAGQIHAVTAGTAATDAVNKTQMETAIATAGLPATAGTVLNSLNDTTAGYVSQKITGSGAVVISTTSPGGNEKTNISVGSFGLTSASAQTGSFAPAVNTRQTLTKSGAVTVTLPAAPAVGDAIQLEIGGASGLVTYALNGLKYYGSTVNPTSAAEGVQTFIYHSAARGWIDA